MTSILCDLISDIHVDERALPDWSDQATSPFCIVAGDVARNRNTLKETLTHLGQSYQQVFYVDGNDEHRDYLDNIDASYEHLVDMLMTIPNVVYLRNDIVVLNGIALVSANGWWNFDFESGHNIDETLKGYCEYVGVTRRQALKIIDHAQEDVAYLINSVKKVQVHTDITAVVMVTHTLPCSWLISHDIALAGTERVNCIGNQHMTRVFDVDFENKIKMWCFGHYHLDINRELNGVQYTSNVRGRYGTPWFKHAYYPKRLHIED
jgi:hypothetical protein